MIFIHASGSTTDDCAMHTIYNEPPSTPTRSPRPVTAQTPSRSRHSSALLPSTPATARSSATIQQTEAGSGPGSVGNGDPTLITYTTISQEYASLRYPGHCPLGMYLIPDKDNLFVWDGVFFVHQGQSPANLSNPPCFAWQSKTDTPLPRSRRSFSVIYDDTNSAFIKAITRIAS